MKSRINIICAVLFLIIGAIIGKYIENINAKNYKYTNILTLVFPERLRAFIAARLWEKADFLMHKGPILEKQNFSAGSYAGNTDIIPYLKMVITLCPNEVAPYRLLASNYAYHLGLEKEALNLIDEAILKCSNTSQLHELYATAAFILLFSPNSSNSKTVKEKLKLAGNYLDKAIVNIKKIDNYSDSVFKLENYYIIKSRIFWELNEPNEAISSWYKSGKSLENSTDRLAIALLKYKNNGTVDNISFQKTDNNSLNNQTNSDNTIFQNNIDFESNPHCDEHSKLGISTESQNYEISKNNKSPLQTMIWLTFKAGFLCLSTIILWFLCSRFS